MAELRSPTGVSRDGKPPCCGASVGVMELGEPDESGRRRPQPTGEIWKWTLTW
uniref:hypothetical protein n=1 Tax=Mobiluncus holmesii TaxID=144178 RepID=UPI0021CBDC8A|nr:hypothetical protein [Mobiluncus holmesii]